MLSALKTKRARAGLVVLALLALTGAAVAYFTSTGSGSGSASAGTSTPLTISATINTSGLLPGTSAPVSFTVNNPSSGNEEVGTVSLTGVAAYTDSGMGTPIPGCSSSWFSMTSVAENQDVGSGTTSLTNGGTLKFNDSTTTSQDACKTAYLVASFTSN